MRTKEKSGDKLSKLLPKWYQPQKPGLPEPKQIHHDYRSGLNL
jgi:hypothetical protein